MTIKTLATWLASRARTHQPTTVVLHATAGGSATSSISWLRQIGLGYHYVIDRDGTVYKCVPTSRVAYHAGTSFGPQGSDVNGYSIGIAFANRNDGEPYTPAQIESAKELVKQLAEAMPSLRWLTTHYAITLGKDGKSRKTDPRGFANMQTVADGKLELWKPSYAARYAL